MCTRLLAFWHIAANILKNFGVCRFVEGYSQDEYTLHAEGVFVEHIRNYPSSNSAYSFCYVYLLKSQKKPFFLATDTQIGHFKATKLCTEICIFVNPSIRRKKSQPKHVVPSL